MPKAIINESLLPPFTVFKDGTFGYRIRYRIVSSDFNNASQYSPIYVIKPNFLFERRNQKAQDDFVIFRQGPYVNLIWEQISIRDRISKNLIRDASRYDVWLNWNRGEGNAVWVRADQTDGVLQAVIVPSFYDLTNGTRVSQEPTRLSVEIYLRATVPSRNNSALLVYKKNNEDISVPLPPPST